MTHQCPGPECVKQIAYERLACPPHWFQVPVAIRNAVYRAWANGEGAGTIAHTRAMEAAIARMSPLRRSGARPRPSP